MSLTSLMIHDVTIQRAGSTTDRYGDVIRNWATATETTVRGWVANQGAVGRAGLQEVLDGREAQISHWICYLPAGTDVTGLDRVVWEGTTFEVDGPINPAWSPRLGAVHHVELQLRVVAG